MNGQTHFKSLTPALDVEAWLSCWYLVDIVVGQTLTRPLYCTGGGGGGGGQNRGWMEADRVSHPDSSPSTLSPLTPQPEYRDT